MRNLISISICLIFIVISCSKSGQQKKADVTIPDGIYTGTFQRQTSAGGQVSNVSITFSAGTWSGQSDIAHYPALCHGSYNIISSDSIRFNNACAWTADFDWSLVLSSDYKIKISGKDVELSRSYDGVYTDVYKLTK